MSNIGDRERRTQDRVIRFFQKVLQWEYLGNWEERENRNVEEQWLRNFLAARYAEPLVNKAIHELQRVAGDQSRDLYDVNKDVYRLLRYGVRVSEELGTHKETVQLIDWEAPQTNHFGIAEEVSVLGENRKRPDLVLYVNGIALGVIELKRGTVSVSEGIRQNLDNQQSHFIQRFFTTLQLVIAGNDTEGARYGTILTPEKYYLKWKEESRGEYQQLLDRHLFQLCNKERFLELIHDFTLFDGGIKKVCRPHQYFGVRAAQQKVVDQEGGIIWHCQGSGKSLTMVWLTQWIREHIEDARVLVITDRDELDKQIVRVFSDAGEQMRRARSGADLINLLNKNDEPLICSLIHKFGSNEEGDYDRFIEEIRKSLPKDFKAKGRLHVFVDECHRTQSGKLHKAMKTILPEALFIGFTGTPLLHRDKGTSLEVFGPYIHTYKFDEAVEDKVVLDLRYEARDIDQRITDQASIDEWFEATTRGLTALAKAELKKRWGTLRKLFSSKGRLEKIVFDILKDFRTKPRLATGEGNAILVAGSVYEACKFYDLFQEAGFPECAIVTSYEPSVGKIKGQTTGGGRKTEELEKYATYMKMLGGKDTETFEDEVKKQFIKEPGRMKLLIVVDKLLTGFDAPAATYLYIDKSMQDHGLFQAICRVNRLDSEDKEFGFIVDYKDLFRSLKDSIKDYTCGAFDAYDKRDVEGLLKHRLEMAHEELDAALEAVIALCEPLHPRDQVNFIRFFCGDPEQVDDLARTEDLRLSLYKLTAALIRAFSNIANELADAGYTKVEADRVRKEVAFYTNLRDEIKRASGDHIDLKAYEADMRQLIDMYISADPSRKISAFDDLSLVDLIVKYGISALDSLPEGIRTSKAATAETIENNVRRVIIEERPTNPKYFDNMSELLDKLIQDRRNGVLEYQAYLMKVEDITRRTKRAGGGNAYPPTVDTEAKRALYDNLEHNVELTIALDAEVRRVKQDGWKGHRLREKEVRLAVRKILPEAYDLDAIFSLIKSQREY
ncbi:MAG: HsdR family type I site-specific deoxyribonuclease [Flavobacteriales bacterium]|nr:HsdR family type I site-specific deoxyribonuclease [Flavobacteriales bacterium]